MNINKKFVIMSALVLLVMVGVAFIMNSASATHPQVWGDPDCDKVTWTVSGDPAYPDATATVVSQSLVTTPTFVGKSLKGSESATGTSPAEPGTTQTLSISVQFDTHEPGQLVTQEATVTIPTEGCEEEPPPCVPEDYNGDEPGCGEPPEEECPADQVGTPPNCETPEEPNCDTPNDGCDSPPPTDDSSKSSKCVGNALVTVTVDSKGNKTTDTINGHKACRTQGPQIPPAKPGEPVAPTVTVVEEGM